MTWVDTCHEHTLLLPRHIWRNRKWRYGIRGNIDDVSSGAPMHQVGGKKWPGKWGKCTWSPWGIPLCLESTDTGRNNPGSSLLHHLVQGRPTHFPMATLTNYITITWRIYPGVWILHSNGSSKNVRINLPLFSTVVPAIITVGTTVENKGKLILTEIFPLVQKLDIF